MSARLPEQRPLRDYQSRACAEVEAHWPASRAVCLVAPTGCHARGQEILLADGEIRRVEEIRVGDLLAGPSGPRRVQSLVRGHGEMLRIVPTKGAPFVVNLDHVLTLVRTCDGPEPWARGGAVIDVTVREWLAWPPWRKHVHKLFRAPVEFTGEHHDLPIPAYVLGALLGDGSLRRTPAITTADGEVLEAVASFAASLGLRVAPGQACGAARIYGFSGARTRAADGRYAARTNELANRLNTLGATEPCGTKRIPRIYKTASVAERLELLAGLIDTDGSLSGAGFDFISKSRHLAEDAAFVARSVGLAAYVTPCIKRATNSGHTGGVYHRVSISGDCSRVPVRISRKRASARRQKKNHLRTGFTVDPIGPGEFFGFSLDGDGRFLLGDFTVTHNSGKTRMGSELAVRHHLAAPEHRVLWLTHRVELIDQSRDALEERGLDVGVLAGRRAENTEADTIVAGWQTLVSRSTVRPAATLVIVDEAHHAAADEWAQVLAAYPDALILGLTATPQRKDGRPLSPPFTSLVVAAQYSELIRAGHLVPCRLLRPPEALGSDLAKEPLQAYEERCRGKQAVVFARSIEEAERLALAFDAAGHAAQCISADTASAARTNAIDAFKAGELRVLTCVFTLTEGFDHPATEVCILARGCGHTGTYMQMVGRVLRPAPGKSEAIVIDLPGLSWVHGTPTEDRRYTLDGRPISSSGALRVCPECGYTWEPNGDAACPSCGAEPEKVEAPRPKIYDMALEEVYAGAETPDSAKDREWTRLRELCKQRGWTIGFAIREFKKLFSHAPPIGTVTDDEWRAEFLALEAFRVKRGYKPGFALVRFKEMSGKWPRREWRA